MFRVRGGKTDKEWGDAVEGGGGGERWMWKDSMYGAFCIIIHNAVIHLGPGVIFNRILQKRILVEKICSIFTEAHVGFMDFYAANKGRCSFPPD